MTTASPSGDVTIGAIDAGSNAIRLAIARIDSGDHLEITLRRREPLRLGADAFRRGQLRPDTIRAAVECFRSLHDLLRQHDVRNSRAVATSAMRAAANGAELADQIRSATGIGLEIISAEEEAMLALLAAAERFDLPPRPLLLVEMGGGSVELTVASNGQILATQTLPLGPLRVLEELRAGGRGEADAAAIARPGCEAARRMIEDLALPGPLDLCIGSGGNLEALARALAEPVLGRPPSDRLDRPELSRLATDLPAMPVRDRMDVLGLPADRADLIAIASIVLDQLMDAVGVRAILVPGISLIDGVLWQVAREIRPAARGPRMSLDSAGPRGATTP